MTTSPHENITTAAPPHATTDHLTTTMPLPLTRTAAAWKEGFGWFVAVGKKVFGPRLSHPRTRHSWRGLLVSKHLLLSVVWRVIVAVGVRHGNCVGWWLLGMILMVVCVDVSLQRSSLLQMQARENQPSNNTNSTIDLSQSVLHYLSRSAVSLAGDEEVFHSVTIQVHPLDIEHGSLSLVKL